MAVWSEGEMKMTLIVVASLWWPAESSVVRQTTLRPLTLVILQRFIGEMRHCNASSQRSKMFAVSDEFNRPRMHVPAGSNKRRPRCWLFPLRMCTLMAFCFDSFAGSAQT